MARNDLSEKYKLYMRSDKWRAIRKLVLKRAGGRCEGEDQDSEDGRCEETAHLEVHHLTYARLGHELLTDLKVVCPICHELADISRHGDKEDEAVDFGKWWGKQLQQWGEQAYGYGRDYCSDYWELKFIRWMKRGLI